MLWEEKILFTVWVARTQDFNFIEWQLSSVFKYAHFDNFPKGFDIFVIQQMQSLQTIARQDVQWAEPQMNMELSRFSRRDSKQQKMKISAI